MPSWTTGTLEQGLLRALTLEIKEGNEEQKYSEGGAGRELIRPVLPQSTFRDEIAPGACSEHAPGILFGPRKVRRQRMRRPI